ncbi:MAG: PcfB family protein, partial [Subdoligranulum variabile]|nr:PcfB family protein [Subdoligranulum variabile]
MNYGSEPADQVVRYSLEGAEFALRISGTAAKNFFIFAQAVLHDSKKTHGKTHLIRLLKEQKPLKFFTVDKDRMHDFARAAKAHGLLFCPIRDKMDPDHIEIAILQDDASKANRIIDKLQLAIVDTGTAELIDTVQQERSEPTPETERVQTEDGAVDFEVGADEEQFNMVFPQGSENASPSEP